MLVQLTKLCSLLPQWSKFVNSVTPINRFRACSRHVLVLVLVPVHCIQGCKREELRRRVLQCRAQLRVLHGGLETELLSAGRQEDEDDQVALSPAASADGEGEEREAAQLPAPVLFEGQGPETQSTRGTFLSTPEPPAEGGHVQGTTTQTLSEHRVTPTYQEEGGVSPPNNGKDDASSLHDAAPSSCSPPLLPEQQPAPASLATLSSDPVRSSSPDDHDAHRSPPAAQELQQQVDYQLRPMPEDEANAAGERDELDVGESGPHPTPDQDPASDLIPVPRSTVKAAAVPQRALSQSVVDALTSSVASSADFPRPANGPPDAQSLSEYAESAYTVSDHCPHCDVTRLTLGRCVAVCLADQGQSDKQCIPLRRPE